LNKTTVDNPMDVRIAMQVHRCRSILDFKQRGLSSSVTCWKVSIYSLLISSLFLAVRPGF